MFVGWEGGGEDVVSALAFGSRRLVPSSSRMSRRSSGSIAPWETLLASSLVWACCSTIVLREFGLIGCSRDKGLVWLIGCARDKGLVGVEVGFGSENF